MFTMPLFVALQWTICATAFAEAFPYVQNIGIWWEIHTFPNALFIIPAVLIAGFIKWGITWYLILYRLPQDREVWMWWMSVLWLIAVGVINALALVLAQKILPTYAAEHGFDLEIEWFDYLPFVGLVVAIAILVLADGINPFLEENRVPSVKRSGKQWFTIYSGLVGWLALSYLLPLSASNVAEFVTKKGHISLICIMWFTLVSLWKEFKAFDKAFNGLGIKTDSNTKCNYAHETEEVTAKENLRK